MRNAICDALILKTRRKGDYDKQISLITPDLGLLDATVYGAYRGRSRLSGSTEQFVRLKAYLYFNPVRNLWKLTDADVLDTNRGIVESLDKIMAASAGAELILKTHAAGGEGERLFGIASDLFQSLDHSNGSDLDYLLIQFLWRYIEISGFLPDLSICPECGRDVAEGEDMAYVPVIPAFCCVHCAGPGNIPVSAGIRRYLQHTLSLPWEKAAAVRMTRQAAEECRGVLGDYIQAVMDIPVNSLMTGGISL